MKTYLKKTKNWRGYSSLEMQFLRNTLLICGYDHVYRRKIFELIYSYVFFSGLKSYFKEIHANNIDKYKEYIIYLYYKNIKCSTKNTTYKSFEDYFGCSIDYWSMDALFVLILSLSGKKFNEYYVSYYNEIVEEYGLDSKICEDVFENDTRVYEIKLKLKKNVEKREIRRIYKQKIKNVKVIRNAITKYTTIKVESYDKLNDEEITNIRKKILESK